MATVESLYTGNAGADLTSYDEVLKEFYLAEIREQINKGTTTYDMLQKGDRNIAGRIVKMALHVQRSRASHAIQTQGQTPDAGAQGYINASWPWKRVVHTILVDSDILDASRTEDGAWIDAMESEIFGGVADIKSRINRMLYRDGSGRVALVSAITNAATGRIIVKHPFDCVDGAVTLFRGGLPGDVQIDEWLGIVNFSYNASAGEPQFLHTPSSGVQRHFRVCASDPATNEITLSSSATGTTGFDLTSTEVATNTAHGIAAGDVLVLCRLGNADTSGEYSSDATFHALTNLRTTSSTNANTGSKDFMGLFGFANNADLFDYYDTSAVGGVAPLQGVDADTYPLWRGFKSNATAGGVTLDEDMIHECGDTIEEKGQTEEWIWLMNRIDRRRYEKLMRDDIRYTQLQRGDRFFDATVIQGRAIVVDMDCPASNLLAVNLGNIMFNRMADLHWDDKDGHILNRMPKHLGYEARLLLKGDFSIDRRNAIGWIPNVAA